MTRVGRKLHSRSGASMLLALLFLLVCLTVGAAVLTAASANTGRLVRCRQEQQSYLTVSSAVQLLKEDCRGMEFTGAYQKWRTETVVVETVVDPETGETTTSSHTEYSGPFYAADTGETKLTGSAILRGVAGEDLKQLYYSTVPELGKTAPLSMSYTVELAAGEHDLDTVTCDVEVAMESRPADGVKRYTVLATLYGKDGQDPITLKLTPTVSRSSRDSTSSSGDTTTYTTTYITKVTWEDVQIIKGANG